MYKGMQQHQNSEDRADPGLYQANNSFLTRESKGEGERESYRLMGTDFILQMMKNWVYLVMFTHCECI